MAKLAIALSAIITLLGCAHEHLARLPIAPDVRISLSGVRDGQCRIANVMLDAKDPKHYIVECAHEK